MMMPYACINRRKNLLAQIWVSQKRVLSTVSIGDIVLSKGRLTESSCLVPANPFPTEIYPPEIVYHLRWMAQKYQLGQDMFLCGHPGPLRRHLVMSFAKVCNYEVEYLNITRDTTEVDLKQRREIDGNSVHFHDQAPTRAALQGRILVLDGIEYAERNVLPTLNNLLENREMNLEDGRFLMKQSTIDAIESSNNYPRNQKLVAVHPNFRVIALGRCVPPYAGQAMDPPLRSRLQSHFIDELSAETLLEIHSDDMQFISESKVKELVSFYESLRNLRNSLIVEGSMIGMPVFSSDSFAHCMRLLRHYPLLSVSEAIARCTPAVTWMNQSLPTRIKSSVQDLVSVALKSATLSTLKKNNFNDLDAPVISDLLESQKNIIAEMMMDPKCDKHICILGPKGSGKSYAAKAFGFALGYKVQTFPLYNEMMSRDLLQRRITVSADGVSAGAATKSTWIDSPLVAVIRSGGLCVLDGVDRVDRQVLYTLRSLLQDGFLDLPSGERLRVGQHPFRLVALGVLSESSSAADDARTRWISSDLGFAYHLLPVSNSDDCLTFALAKGSSHLAAPKTNHTGSTQAGSEWLKSAIQSLDSASASKQASELKLNFRQLLRLGRLSYGSKEDLVNELERMLLIKFASDQCRKSFYDAMAKAQLIASTEMPNRKNFSTKSQRPSVTLLSTKPSSSTSSTSNSWNKSSGSELSDSDIYQDYIHISRSGELRIGDVTVPQRVPKRLESVPQPLFYFNRLQASVLRDILFSYKSGERSILLIGNQGVGKNKMADKLLNLLNAEREYIQLHRDTTIHSLTSLPTLEDGRITYKDSPMLRAAREGSVLVVDEADKAPLEVVCLLKALADDGEVVLQDGRRLLSQERLREEGGDPRSPPANVVLIHSDFLLLVLANRPGFPFLGNNFFKECGDVFATHVIDNLDVQSEVELLSAYAGDRVERSLLTKIASAFASLRDANIQGELSYPFSARDAVAVTKHLSAFPGDGIATAIDDILGFDSLALQMREKIAAIFSQHGLSVNRSVSGNGVAADFGKWRIVDGSSTASLSREGGPSDPRFSPSAPKHGKEDPDNKPHVGGNTWAGGTGGSDTAGLGGVGGPYRLDKGHTVHQVSDEVKARISDASRAQAAKIAKEALKKRLEDIAIGQHDYQIYLHYRSKVEAEIAQLRAVLAETARRRQERVWLRHQTYGDLDDGKLVDGLAGEQRIFKRRGNPEDQHGNAFSGQSSSMNRASSGDLNRGDHSGSGGVVEKRIHFVMDVSGSMYRFNGRDRRLERMLETMVLILEAMPDASRDGGEDRGGRDGAAECGIDYCITGHSGDSARISYLEFAAQKPKNEAERFALLETMVAHSQFTLSGDNTLEAVNLAIDDMVAADDFAEGSTDRYVIVVSDANFERYNISPKYLSAVMSKDSRVHVHLVLIASLADEAQRVAAALPVGRVHLCFASSNLPSIMRSILTQAASLA